MNHEEQIRYIQDKFFVLPRFSRKTFIRRNPVYEGEELYKSHMEILIFLAEEGPHNMSEMSTFLSQSKANLTVLADKLHKLGLVERKNDARDRRLVYLELTDKGKHFLAEDLKKVQSEHRELLNEYSTDKLDLMTEILDKMSLFLNMK